MPTSVQSSKRHIAVEGGYCRRFQFRPGRLPIGRAMHHFLPVISFLRRVLNGGDRVILRSFSSPSRTVISVHGNVIDNHGINNPTASLTLGVVRSTGCHSLPFVANCRNHNTKNGALRSTACFVHRGSRVINVLYIGASLSAIHSVGTVTRRLVTYFSTTPAHARPTPVRIRDLSRSARRLVSHDVTRLLDTHKLSMTSLNRDSHISIVHRLGNGKIFVLGNTITYTTASLNVSRPDICHCLRGIHGRNWPASPLKARRDKSFLSRHLAGSPTIRAHYEIFLRIVFDYYRHLERQQQPQSRPSHRPRKQRPKGHYTQKARPQA